MTSILEFLSSRNVPDAEQICQKMEFTKVDINVLSALTEDDFLLNEWLPKHEDRMAIINWAKQIQSSEINLFDELPNVLNDEEEEDGPVESLLEEILENIEVQSIRIQMGWIHFDQRNGYERVTKTFGGGIREVECPSTSKVDDLLNLSKVLFFSRENMSIYGCWEEFDTTIVDYEEIFIGNSTIVEDLFDAGGRNGIPRCYLVTREKALETVDPEAFAASQRFFHPLAFIRTTNTLNDVEYNSGTDTDTDLQCASSSTSHVSVLETAIPSTVTSEDPESEFYYYGDLPDDEDESQVYSRRPLNVKRNKFTFYRGNVFEEMLQSFRYAGKYTCETVYIELLHPNGYPEQGVDTGGVLRDTLSEFWTTMYETCTIGTDMKIPCLSHTFTEEKWRIVAKILYMGWINSKYLPIKLAMPILEQILFGQVTSELVPPFLQTLSINDRHILSCALMDFTSVEKEDLITVLGNLECHVIPNANNLKVVLQEIAHMALIQKPYFIIKQFQTELNNLGKNLSGILTKEKLYELYKSMEPTTKNIMSMLICEYSDCTKYEIMTYGFLKRFILTTTDDLRIKFLRFCTGADLITGNHIIVRFSEPKWYNHYAPIAHTCSCILQLPLKYLDYEHFEMEIDCILSSNFWAMDTY
ncbi:HECT domain [Cinara cedri]|uniref:HECT domain n=1 Tax=Cinara cedri TaxID=506608 RepID=A0A5E4MIH2_9HEMI|nr:HECT domain [Cinara cedri]